METKLLTTAENDLKIAADILNNGGNVIIPTETVYGLAADAMNPKAVKNIFKAKGRPSDNPLIVHIASLDMLKGIVSEVTENAKILMENFWPGPLTIILKKCKNVPYETTGGLETVAVRMPKNETAREIIKISNLALAAPSANLSGKPSPTSFEHCVDDMQGRVDAIINGGDCDIGVESTVIDLSGDKPVLLRPGGITLEQLEKLIGEVDVVTSVKEGEPVKSPGLKYKHYSPEAEVEILSGSTDEVLKFIADCKESQKTGVLIFDEFPDIFGVETISLGSIKKPDEAAHRLFSALRKMDELGVKKIYAPEIGTSNGWRAVRNRLYRAAGGRIVNVSELKGKQYKKILFVCTGNTCRSPMAQALFNYFCSKNNINAIADSCGIYADGSVISQNSCIVLNECGIDYSDRRSKMITAEMIENSDLVLTMSVSHKTVLNSLFGDSDKIQTLSEFAESGQDILDPFGCDLGVYRKCRDEINLLIEKAARKL